MPIAGESNTNIPMLSGSAYVVMRDSADPETRASLFGARLHKPRNCGHVTTVCVQCAVSWSWDHVIFFQRTGGGRNLANELGWSP